MARTVDLWAALPPFLRDYLEFAEVLKAEEPEMQALAEASQGILRDMFIATASEAGLARMEALAGVKPDPGEPLEQRRAALQARWYNRAPLTLRTLGNRLRQLQEHREAEAVFDPEDPFHLTVRTWLSAPGKLEALEYILRSVLPANLRAEVENTLEIRGRLDMGIGAGGSGTQLVRGRWEDQSHDI